MRDWKSEFGHLVDIGPVAERLVALGFEDRSWLDDNRPGFVHPGLGICVWVNAVSQKDGLPLLEDSSPFSICRMEPDGVEIVHGPDEWEGETLEALMAELDGRLSG